MFPVDFLQHHYHKAGRSTEPDRGYTYQPVALPPVSIYLATAGLSTDAPGPSLDDAIDRLSGCLERVVAAKVVRFHLTRLYEIEFYYELLLILLSIY